MTREPDTFCFPAPRPTDWPSTVSVLHVGALWAKVRGIGDASVCRLVPKELRNAKEAIGRYPAQDHDAQITVMIEGWAEVPGQAGP